MNEILYYLTQFGTYAITIIFIIILMQFIFGQKLKTHHSHWNTLIDNFEYSPKDFYTRLKKELESHGVTKISIKETTHKEAGIMSYSRLYLRATWKDYQYDICGSKFGNGFFVSWWLLYKNSTGKILVSKIPFIGGWLARKLYPITYYRIDTASMFMSYTQSSVLKVIEDITNNKGVRALTVDEKKPILNNIFIR